MLHLWANAKSTKYRVLLAGPLFFPRWACSGGNLGGAGGHHPPPPPSRKMPNFRKFSPKRGLKTAFSSANREVCWKFESFVGNLEGFAPPPSLEKVNFRHWACTRAILHLVNASNFIILFCLLPDDSIYQGPVVQKLVSLILS
jgi:hypothetical protein